VPERAVPERAVPERAVPERAVPERAVPERECDLAVFVGRFQPPHRGDVAAIRHGLGVARQVLVLSRAARQPRSTRAPFRFKEVEACLLDALEAQERARVCVRPVVDHYDDPVWRREVSAAVGGAARVMLIGPEGEEVQRLCRLFPAWAAKRLPAGAARTAIREDYLLDPESALARWDSELPANVQKFLRGFARGQEYAELAREATFIREGRARWAAAPWPPIFVTVDAVVLAKGHVLLVERARRPGKGLWALPGGFVDASERIEAAMRRELVEETAIGVGAEKIAKSIRAARVFDEPCRSARGRTITHAFLVVLEGCEELPKVAGGDDAARAFWLPIGAIEPEQMFEDHCQIIEAMLAASNRSAGEGEKTSG
jgi:bifunctional NMN adenylyltransferase/nudix hydrolase